jgi:hypothetical protein
VSRPVRPRFRTLAWIAIAIASLAAGPGCQASRESQGSTLERQGSRGPHRFRLRSDLRPARLTLGDPAVWKLTAEMPRGAHALGVLRDSAGPWMDVTAIREPGPKGEDVEGRGAWELEYRLRAFDLGRIPVPRVAIVVAWPGPRASGAQASDTLEFPPDTLTVDSLTTAAVSALEADRGPIRPGLRPVDIALVALGGLLVLAAVVAAVLLWRARRRKAIAPETAAPEPAEAPFRRAIDALRSEVESLPRDVFYERLSLAIRAYIRAVTGAPALDLTTRELAHDLTRRGTWKPEAVRALAHTLDRSDLAKFARHEDPLGEARTALDDASSLTAHFSAPPPASEALTSAGAPNASASAGAPRRPES